MIAGKVKGISLCGREAHQVISQYANDSSLTILAKKDSILTIVRVVEDFKLDSKLKPIGRKALLYGVVLSSPTLNGCVNLNGNECN